MADLFTPMLDQLRAGFADRGWNPDDLARFHMDGDSIDAVLDRIEGGQDAPTDPPPAAPAPEPAKPASEPTATDPATPDADLGKFGEHADYIRQLRAENARYRTERNTSRDELGRFTSAFEGLDDATRDTLLALPQHLRDDPRGTAEWMRAQAEQILEASPAIDDPREGGKDEDRPLTRKEVDAILAERDDQAAVNQQVAAIYNELEQLGVGKDSEQATAIMSLAASHFGGDIAKAHAQMAKWAQDAVDQFVAGKAKGVDTPTPTPASAGSVQAGEKKITNLKDAREALEADLAAKGMK